VDAVVQSLSRNWWLFLMQGVLSIIIGILALVWPGHTLAVVLILVGLFALLNGIVEVFAAIGAAGNHEPFGGRLAMGILGILAGLAIMRWPGITALIALFIVGIWAILIGVIGIVGAIAQHEEFPHAWLVALLGIVSVLFGIAMMVWPVAGVLTLVFLAGIFAIVFGIINCVIAFRVRTLPRRLARPSPPPGAAPSF
jgi:uncharacterized membrane protein HdeD (DUF308 family)